MLSQSKTDETPQQEDHQTALPTIVSPVLQQCYNDMLDYNTTYGHPNIPLPAGRPLVTLRRLYSQNKLAASDIELLNDLKFTWNSLEDVYTENVDRFDDFLQRLLRYADAHNGDPSPPKKYPPDPELGAWVTGIRRLRTVPDAVDPAHVRALDAMGFAWTSPRQQQCGSQFMVRYRDIQQRCFACVDDENGNNQDASLEVWRDPAVVAWIRAQQRKATELSSTRQHYMAQLLPTDPGESWLEWEPPAAEKE